MEGKEHRSQEEPVAEASSTSTHLENWSRVDRRGAGLCGSLLLGRQLRAQDQVVEDALAILGNVNGLFASVVIGTNVAAERRLI